MNGQHTARRTVAVTVIKYWGATVNVTVTGAGSSEN